MNFVILWVYTIWMRRGDYRHISWSEEINTSNSVFSYPRNLVHDSFPTRPLLRVKWMRYKPKSIQDQAWACLKHGIFKFIFSVYIFFQFWGRNPTRNLTVWNLRQPKYDIQTKAANFCVFVTDLPVLNWKNLIRLSFEFLKAATGEMESLPIRNW